MVKVGETWVGVEPCNLSLIPTQVPTPICRPNPTTVITCAQCASGVKSTKRSIQSDHHSHSPSEFCPFHPSE